MKTLALLAFTTFINVAFSGIALLAIFGSGGFSWQAVAVLCAWCALNWLTVAVVVVPRLGRTIQITIRPSELPRYEEGLTE